MKPATILGLAGLAMAAPTPTLDDRQLGSSSSNPLAGLASLIPSGLGNSGSSSASSSDDTSSGGLSSLLGGGDRLFPREDLTKRQLLGSSTSNDVTDKKSCQPLTFIFARGTTELGNMGNVVGPPVAQQLKSLTGSKVNVQGVDYPADAAGNASGGSSGGPKMASLAKQALQQCPKTKVVLGGYSQGSMVVHNAASSLDENQVAAAILFGDPFKMLGVGKVPSSKVKEFCAEGDPVCENGANFLAHLSYGGKAKEAAQFVVQATGVSS